jgi:hypothetical protein
LKKLIKGRIGKRKKVKELEILMRELGFWIVKNLQNWV